MKKIFVMVAIILAIAGAKPVFAQDEESVRARTAAAEGRMAIEAAEETLDRTEKAAAKATAELDAAKKTLEAADKANAIDEAAVKSSGQVVNEAEENLAAAKAEGDIGFLAEKAEAEKFRQSTQLKAKNRALDAAEVAPTPEIKAAEQKIAAKAGESFRESGTKVFLLLEKVADIKRAVEIVKEAHAGRERDLEAAVKSGATLTEAQAKVAELEGIARIADAAKDAAKKKLGDTKKRVNPALVAASTLERVIALPDRAEVEALRTRLATVESALESAKLTEMNRDRRLADAETALREKADAKTTRDSFVSLNKGVGALVTRVDTVETDLMSVKDRLAKLESTVKLLEGGISLSKEKMESLIDLLDRYETLTPTERDIIFESLKKLTEKPAEGPKWKVQKTQKWVYDRCRGTWAWTDNGWMAVEQ